MQRQKSLRDYEMSRPRHQHGKFLEHTASREGAAMSIAAPARGFHRLPQHSAQLRAGPRPVHDVLAVPHVPHEPS